MSLGSISAMRRFWVQEAPDSKELVIATNSAHDVTLLGAGEWTMGGAGGLKTDHPNK